MCSVILPVGKGEGLGNSRQRPGPLFVFQALRISENLGSWQLDERQDIKRLLGIAGVSLTLILGTTGLANAAPAPGSDGDHDGLTYSQEVKITHTSPRDADSDNDRIKDGQEDSDNDGIDDSDERSFGTQINDSDSDDDGVLDGNEDKDRDGTDNEDEDDGTADQGKGHLGGDVTSPGDDDGTADQGPGDNGGVDDDSDEDEDNDGIADEDEDDGTPDQGPGDVAV
jgi:hypothetical protein